MFKSIDTTVCLAVIIVCINFGNGFYILQRDLAQITGVEPPKRWLVFMEAEFRKCKNTEMIALLRCLSHCRKYRKQCYSDIGIFYNSAALMLSPNSIQITNPSVQGFVDFSCKLQSSLDTRIYVHKLFILNLNIQHFQATTLKDQQPIQGKCPRRMPSVNIIYDGGSHVYCGRKYPWSIYSHSGMARVNIFFPFFSWINLYVKIKITIDITEHDFIQTQPQSYPSIVTPLSTYQIQMIHISVEFLYRIVISVTSDFDKLSGHIIYDGPHYLVPTLSAYSNTQHELYYMSSTYQAYIVCAPPSNTSRFRIQYTKHGDHTAHALRPREQVILVNNTGCGDSGPGSWMCTYSISTVDHEHGVLRLLFLDITGPFTNTSTSAGIAVYNVINNTAILVHHWYISMQMMENLTVTSTQRKLLFSVYAYSSLAQVSCHLTTGASKCIGIFLNKDLPTSIALLTKHSFYDFGLATVVVGGQTTRFVATFSVNDSCLSIQTSVLPTESDASWLQLVLLFVYDTALKITKYFIQGYTANFCCTVEIRGEYKPIHGPSTVDKTSPFFEIVGRIESITMCIWNECGNMPIVTFVVFQMPCILPCYEISANIANITGIATMCDICNFMFIDRNAFKTYKILLGRIAVLERLIGNLTLDIAIGSPEYQASDNLNTYGRYYISYRVDALVLQFGEARVVRVDVADNEFWSIPLGTMLVFKPGSYNYIPKEIHVLELGMYEYVIERGSPLTGWQSAANQCSIYGGHLLTIHDQRELDFVIQNIMKPFHIEIAWIGMMRQVCRRYFPNTITYEAPGT